MRRHTNTNSTFARTKKYPRGHVRVCRRAAGSVAGHARDTSPAAPSPGQDGEPRLLRRVGQDGSGRAERPQLTHRGRAIRAGAGDSVASTYRAGGEGSPRPSVPNSGDSALEVPHSPASPEAVAHSFSGVRHRALLARRPDDSGPRQPTAREASSRCRTRSPVTSRRIPHVERTDPARPARAHHA